MLTPRTGFGLPISPSPGLEYTLSNIGRSLDGLDHVEHAHLRQIDRREVSA
ncbi:MAG: hypothetical protein ABIQ73_26660 [Acidimicrobiales bacterium]